MEIKLYDESAKDNRNVVLTNLISTVNLVGVHWGHPSGTVRLKYGTDPIPTHFVATIGDREWVYKVNKMNVVNDQVCDYEYSVDYLKDFSYHFGLATTPGNFYYRDIESNPHILLSTEKEVWNKNYPVAVETADVVSTSLLTGWAQPMDRWLYLVVACAVDTDSKIYTDKDPSSLLPVAVPNTRFTTRANSKAGVPYTVYAIPPEDVNAVVKDLIMGIDTAGTADRLFGALYSNIIKAFYLPWGPGQGSALEEYFDFISTDDPRMYFYGADGKIHGHTFYYDNEQQTPDNIVNIRFLRLKLESGTSERNVIVKLRVKTGIHFNIDSANDLPPYKKYQCHIPLVGWQNIPVEDLIYDTTNHTFSFGTVYLHIELRFDILNGTVSVKYLRANTEEQTPSGEYPFIIAWESPFYPLSSAFIPNSNYAQSIINNNQQSSNNWLSTISNAISAAAAGAVTGNPGVAIAAGASSIQSAMSNSISQGASRKSIQNLTISSGQTGDFHGSEYNTYFVLITSLYTEDIDNVGSSIGYPVYKYDKPLLRSNKKYWVDTTATTIPGPDWYADGVRSDLSKEYITYLT